MTSADPSILTAAQTYAQAGWFPLALHGVTSNDDGSIACTCRKGVDCPSRGKHPISRGWESAAAPDFQPFISRRLPTNVGIGTGARSGFFVVDVDTPEGWRDLQALGRLTPTYSVRTGGGGFQLYYQMPAGVDVTNRDKMLPKGVDIRGNGGMVVAPPSRSYKGAYTVKTRMAIAPAPQWLVDLLDPTRQLVATMPTDPTPAPPAAPISATPTTLGPRSQTRRETKLEASIIEGETQRLLDLPRPWQPGSRWDATIYEVACQLVELANAEWSNLTLEQAQDTVLRNAPYDGAWSEAGAKFASAVNSVGGKQRPSPTGPADPSDVFSSEYVPPSAGTVNDDALGAPTRAADTRGWPMRTLDDLGNAKRMVDHFRDQLRWVDEADTWAIYGDGRWQLGSKVAGQLFVQQMIERLEDTEAYSWSPYKDDPESKDPAPRDVFLKYVKTLRMSPRVDACLKQARSMPEFKAKIADFDKYPMHLNCANGIIDLTTGTLLPHNPAAMMMHQCPVDFAIDAPAPRWSAFLQRVMPNVDMANYLQRIVGYSLTGETGEQAMFIHHGTGANGKSVLLAVVSAIVGDYGQVVPRETLLSKGAGSEHPTSIARMVGKRFLQTSETAAGRRLDEEVIKGLTGGEQQTARYMNRDFFDFTPTGKIHYVTNHLPRLTDAESIWRRLHPVKWYVTIPEAERDPRLAELIVEEEASGVLAWIVRGTLAWQQDRLKRPAMAVADRDAYRADQDEFQRFLDQRCIVKPGDLDTVDNLFATYYGWATNARIRNPLTQSDFVRTLRERGFDSMTQNRIPYIIGLLPLVAAATPDLGVFSG